MLTALIYVLAYHWAATSLISMTFGSIVTYFVIYTAKRLQ